MKQGARPLILAPSSPATFLQHVLTERAHPTIILICAAKPDFLNAAVAEIQDFASSHPDQPSEATDKRNLLKATLAQIATSRHIQTAFAPSVVHLRAYLSVFPSAAGDAVQAPPLKEGETQQQQQPALLVYGFLDVHRDGSEWSAQGIGCSAACLVEAAARAGYAAVLMEPRGWHEGDDEGERWAPYEEQIPVLSTTASAREDGTWGVPCTSARTILRRWCTFHDS